MSFDGIVYNVMIASPGDVANERAIAREVIAEWNAVHAPDRRLVLLPISGDVNATPAMGMPPQEVINRQVLRAADLLVGIFWTRIGTATTSYASGTVEEIEEQIKADKPVMLYFSETPVHPDVGASEQYQQLRSFKESLRSRGLFETFSSQAEFREKFNRQLQIKISRDSYFVSKPLPSDAIAEELMIRLQSSIATFLQLPRPNASPAAPETSYEVQALITLAHQTQGQLIGVSGALTAIGSEALSARDKDLVEMAQFLIEDAITVGYGTFSSYALSSGREIGVLESLINPPQELERITRRLQRTTARSDLQLRFSTQLGFTPIHFDKDVFESVFYNIIHNAMKYAETSSVVCVECRVDRGTLDQSIAIKSVGPPIRASERDVIFQRYARGTNVTGGRYHSGAGLGLWISRTLSRAMGADITLELSENARLSVFVIRFRKTTARDE